MKARLPEHVFDLDCVRNIIIRINMGGTGPAFRGPSRATHRREAFEEAAKACEAIDPINGVASGVEYATGYRDGCELAVDAIRALAAKESE